MSWNPRDDGSGLELLGQITVALVVIGAFALGALVGWGCGNG